MKIAICDDEQYFIEELKKVISAYSIRKNVEIYVNEFTCLEALMASTKSFNVIFLDIRFDGKNEGIDWAKRFRAEGNDTLIVLCSSLHDQAIYGYQAEAIRFLAKPISEHDVFDALNACASKLNTSSGQIAIKSNFANVIVSKSHIVYVESVLRKRRIVLKGNEEITTYETLNDLYNKLDKRRFAFTHKSFLVQLKMVDRIDSNTAFLTTGDKIPISKSVRAEFKYKLMEFVEGDY